MKKSDLIKLLTEAKTRMDARLQDFEGTNLPASVLEAKQYTTGVKNTLEDVLYAVRDNNTSYLNIIAGKK